MAIGIGKETVENILKKEYREDLTLEESIKLATKCLVSSLRARGEEPSIKIAVIPVDTKKFRMLSEEEVKAYIKEVQGSETG
ncbi:MAG: proteasome endopeptidase complex,subunit alpha [Candidatus Bathyarchaeota archaeon B26-1]|nr:MAG: proteasome endopeptidase complex,subunit alpha [Candidatus Bathyarchaeota archaeon B26-1]